MHSEDKLLYNFFSNLDGQLTIPIYQRGPAWKDENYLRLWDDLIDSVEEGHWLDRTICKKFDQNVLAGDLCEIHIIDGQQRFTAMIVLFTAICAYCKNNNIEDIPWENLIYNTILINPRGEGDKKYRLKLRGEYNEILKQLIDKLPVKGGVKAPKRWKSSSNNSNEVLRMYNAFYEKLNNDNIHNIWESVRKVEIVDVQCEDKDNPQRVFDCINSTGVPLRLFEQIKNGTLMEYKAEEQSRLYYEYWEPLVTYFGHQVGKFDGFFKIFMKYLKKEKVSYNGREYVFFKRYMESNNMTSEDFLKELRNIFEYYKIFRGDETSGDYEIDQAFANLVIFGAENSLYPILMCLYSFYDNEDSYKEDLLSALKFLETHMMRGVICGRKVQNVLKAFNLNYIDKRNLTQSLISGFLKLNSGLISDFDFKRGITRNREWYSGAMMRITKGFLKRIEMSYHTKGKVSFKRYSIEHIMPQTLNETWKIQLGNNFNDIHDNYINCIGNLTLTAYNAEMSNKTFEEKLNMKDGFKDDRLHLNKSVAKYNHWNEDTINERTELLIDKSLEIWKYPPAYVNLIQ